MEAITENNLTGMGEEDGGCRDGIFEACRGLWALQKLRQPLKGLELGGLWIKAEVWEENSSIEVLKPLVTL